MVSILKALFKAAKRKNCYKVLSFETLESILKAPRLKTLKKVKILKSLFRDFLMGINQIDHEESENRAHETLGSNLRDH